jgi:tRNA A-37 threonylcarbamoyl transferase component Bud32
MAKSDQIKLGRLDAQDSTHAPAQAPHAKDQALHAPHAKDQTLLDQVGIQEPPNTVLDQTGVQASPFTLVDSSGIQESSYTQPEQKGIQESSYTQPEQKGIQESSYTQPEQKGVRLDAFGGSVGEMDASLPIGTELLRRVDHLIERTTKLSKDDEDDEDNTNRSFRVERRKDGAIDIKGVQEPTLLRHRLKENTRPRIDMASLQAPPPNDGPTQTTDLPTISLPQKQDESLNFSDTSAFPIHANQNADVDSGGYYEDDEAAAERTQHMSSAEVASLRFGEGSSSARVDAHPALFYEDESDNAETQQIPLQDALKMGLHKLPPLIPEQTKPLPPLVVIPSSLEDAPSVKEIRNPAKDTKVDGLEAGDWKQTLLDDPKLSPHPPQIPSPSHPPQVSSPSHPPQVHSSLQMPHPPQVHSSSQTLHPPQVHSSSQMPHNPHFPLHPNPSQNQTIADDAQTPSWEATVIRASSLTPKDFQSSASIPVVPIPLATPDEGRNLAPSPSSVVTAPSSSSSVPASLSPSSSVPALSSLSNAPSSLFSSSPKLPVISSSAALAVSSATPAPSTTQFDSDNPKKLVLPPPASAPPVAAIPTFLPIHPPSAPALSPASMQHATSPPVMTRAADALSPEGHVTQSGLSKKPHIRHDVTRTFVKGTVLPRKNQEGLLVAVTPEEKERYEPLQMLGEGGVGQVLLVRDHDILRLAAMKRLKGNKAESALLRFLEEIRHTGQLEHPNIVPIHDVGMDDEGQYYFVMKYVQGEDISTLIGKLREGDPDYHKRYSFERRARMFLEIVEAVRFAHNKQIIHRDLKPGNIRIGAYGEVMVMDWGLSKPFKRDAETLVQTLDGPLPSLDIPQQRLFETQQGILVGTPAYMSPEQAYGKHDAMDQRSDIYSLGVLFYELTTLRHPFESCETLEALLGAITQTDPVPAWSVVHPAQGRVPRELGFMIAKAMARDPAERYGTLEPWAAELEAYLDARSGIYCTSTFVKRGVQGYTHFLDSHRVLAVSLLGLIALSSLLGGVQSLRWLLSLLGLL